MGEKLVVGPIDKGLRKDRLPFNIDNDSFPTLINAYQWRGRVKRKRGTEKLGRLQRYFSSTSTSYSATATITLNGSGVGNILSGFSLQSNASVVPGSVSITGAFGTYTDPAMDGDLSPSGSIIYSSGQITIAAEAGQSVSVVMRYYPALPVMGLEDLELNSDSFPGTLAFDPKYSYSISTSFPYPIHDVSFYKNVATGTYPGYIQKTNWTPTTWNGEDYQQFWTVNYQGALWATNGIEIPFDATNVGMQFKPITNMVVTSVGPPAIVTITIVGHGLVVGDFLFINEVLGFTRINFQTGYVIAVIGANDVSVEFPSLGTVVQPYTGGGIAQYLTNRSDTTKDCLRWYDGDPTNGNATTPAFSLGKGWVNFAPPLSFADFSIADLPLDQYYLVGARMIVPFKDRLLFIGPVVQTSGGTPKYLQDTIIYSQNGTPYYTCSFNGDSATGSAVSPLTIFTPILVPVNQTATAPAFFEDQPGFGGFITGGFASAITTASANEDVLILGVENHMQLKLIYTGNDLVPFNFYTINSELGSTSTFSIINLDQGVITRGNRGFIITSQTQCLRMDMEIPDQVFEISLLNNGVERITSQRDFENEWVYFTYPSRRFVNDQKFPNQTLFYNYRDNSWAVFNESYTHYGQFRKQTGFTWATVGIVYPTWSSWNASWDSGNSNLLQPDIIAGNQQGFVVFREDGTTDETNSLYIQSFSGNTVTSPDHCLDQGDYIVISGVLGTLGSQVNGKVFSVGQNPTQNTFKLKPAIGSGTYLGGGVVKRLYNPYFQTRQFPLAWDMGRKTRIGVQQYLLSKTESYQISLLIFLSQNDSDPYNDGPVVPDLSVDNGSLIYSTVLYTCPESTNLGLTAANINLQTPTGSQQSQIWHRINTSLLGDTVQLGFTMSDAQMRELTEEGVLTNQIAEIELHAFILDVTPSQLLV